MPVRERARFPDFQSGALGRRHAGRLRKGAARFPTTRNGARTVARSVSGPSRRKVSTGRPRACPPLRFESKAAAAVPRSVYALVLVTYGYLGAAFAFCLLILFVWLRDWISF